MDSSEELQYSTDGLAARSILYTGLNDINIYVEDQDKEYLYESILKRMRIGEYRINAIFSCGGKRQVIERYDEVGEYTNGIANIFLVDGDFDRIIRPQEMVNNKHFIYLKAYNIENYYIDEDAICCYMKGKLHCLDKEVKTSINFTYWKSRIVNEAKKLYLLYCYVQKKHPTVPNTSRNPNCFIDYRTGFEKEDGAYEAYLSSIKGLGDWCEQELDLIRTKYEEIYGNDYYYLICGKFLLQSLYLYLSRKCTKSFWKDELTWFLINTFNIHNLDYVKETIIEALNQS